MVLLLPTKDSNNIERPDEFVDLRLIGTWRRIGSRITLHLAQNTKSSAWPKAEKEEHHHHHHRSQNFTEAPIELRPRELFPSRQGTREADDWLFAPLPNTCCQAILATQIVYFRFAPPVISEIATQKTAFRFHCSSTDCTMADESQQNDSMTSPSFGSSEPLPTSYQQLPAQESDSGIISNAGRLAARRTFVNFVLMSVLFSANHGCVVGGLFVGLLTVSPYHRCDLIMFPHAL
jgi:hypothetical protein